MLVKGVKITFTQTQRRTFPECRPINRTGEKKEIKSPVCIGTECERPVIRNVKVEKVIKCVFHGVPGFENSNGVFRVQGVNKGHETPEKIK